ncbi:MAG TPA: nitrile hydratase subunit beta [Candidatus Binataceae bacterium]|nr:nitrile hydratase subunit beta [Candidatus Binataceae bacterium]
MNGIHDLGGMDGFGPVPRGEEAYVAFHSAWEARVFALTNAALTRAGANVDEFRHAIERIAPARYLASGYYQRWLDALETLLIERGILTRSEIGLRAGSEGVAAIAAAPVAAARPRAKHPAAKFSIGARVCARNLNPAGHTRLPRYARGRIGVIERNRGVHVFPDTNAHQAGPARQHVYSVAFRARELFGAPAHARDRIVLDLWEDYLELAAIKPVRRSTARKPKRKLR